MPTYTAEPARHDSTLIVADSWLVQVSLADADGIAIDLTGATGTASIRREPGGEVVATPDVIFTDRAGGEFAVGLDAADTADLQPGTYRWAVRLTWLDGTVRTIVEGNLTIRRAAVA